MIELNFGPIGYFGPNEYIVSGPGLPHIKERPDRIVKIPEKGSLEALPHCILEDLLDSKEVKPYILDLEPAKSGGTFTTVCLCLEFEEMSEYYKEVIYMPWIDQRGEWVVLTYWEQHRPLREDYEGPYELNVYCQRKILEAYRIPEASVKLEDIVKTNPEQLSRISNNARLFGNKQND